MVFDYKKWLLPILILWFATALQSHSNNSNDTSEFDGVSELEPIVVTATKTPHSLKDTPVITNLITREEIEAVGAENIGEVLEHTAGIIIHRDGHGDGVQLQGLDSEYILILVDGEPQVGRIAGKLDMARIAVENVERIEVVKGATSSLFGNSALAGVINIITRKAISPFSIQFAQNIEQYNTFDSRGTVGFQQDKFNGLFTLSANRRSPIDLDESTLTTTIHGYANLTGSAKTEYQITPATNLIFSGQYFTQDQEGIAENGPLTFDQLGDIENFSGSLGVERGFGISNSQIVSPTLLTGKLYATRYDDESTVVNRETEKITSSNLNIQDLLKGEIQFDTKLWEEHQLTLGGEVIFENLQSQRIEGGERGLFTNSLFIQNEYRPIPSFAFVVGGRLDNHSEFGLHFSPKLSSLYRLTDDFLVRASYGQGFRAPDFKDLYLNFTNVTSGYQVLGNPSLKPESSHNWNLGIEYQIFNGLLTRIHGYRNDLHNLIEAERIGQSAAGGSKFEYQNISEAFTEGIDVEIIIGSFQGFTSSVGYAYFRGADKNSGLPLLNRSTHNGTLKIAYLHLNSGFQVDLRGRYASQWGFFDDGDKVLEPEELAPSYWIWNIRTSKILYKSFKVSIGINNIFDFKIPTYYTFIGRSLYGGVSLAY
ncbi:TonB-dependent receptor [Candidatus Poribacteria bacterium]|nr:TonB-dependent receptor [Candidatus Poribacteria bacterium]